MTFNNRWKGKGGRTDRPLTPDAPKAAPAPQKAAPLVEVPMATVPDAVADQTEVRKNADAAEEMQERILAGTVQRVRLGSIITDSSLGGCKEGEHGYVWGLGKKPKAKLSLVTEGADKQAQGTSDDVEFYARLREVQAGLNRYALAEDEGPYADKDGTVVDFANLLLSHVSGEDLYGTINELMGINPSIPAGFNSTFDGDFMSPDVLPTAGEILSQHRLVEDEVSGAKMFTFAHPLEMYVLAVSVLRLRGYPAYLAQAVMPHPEVKEISIPLIAILDLSKDVPLTTFDLFDRHPPAGAIDILSDTAVMGALYAELAEMRIKHLTVEMVNTWSSQEKALSGDEIENQLTRIAQALFESAKRWDGNQLIQKASLYFLDDMSDALISIDPNMSLPDVNAGPADYMITTHGMRLPTLAQTTAKNYAQFMFGQLSRMIAKAHVEEE